MTIIPDTTFDILVAVPEVTLKALNPPSLLFWHKVTFQGHYSAYCLSSYGPGFCIMVWKYSPQTPYRALMRIFGAKRDEVTGEWRKLQIKQDYFLEARNVKNSKAMNCNQYSATKSFESVFRKSGESAMKVFV
jgi:hypothetical protein